MKFRYLMSAVMIASLGACDVETSTTVPQTSQSATKIPRTGTAQSVRDFQVVAARVEPVAESVCRQMRRGENCDFRILIDDRPGLPPNAYQTYDKSGRPIIAFTPALLREMKNRDEVAFALSHEAAHHIEGHISQTQASATTGAVLGAVIGSLAGLDANGVDLATNIGGTVGARRYSKGFELEADSLGARIALRAGYDPLRGVLYFQDADDPGDRFLGTHPPNSDRIRIVRQSVGAQ